VAKHYWNNATIDDLDSYGEYEEEFNPLHNDRQARRGRKQKTKHTPKKGQSQIVSELADSNTLDEGSANTTYRPSRHESGWLMNSLSDFIRQDYIVDVMALVTGGKEASVYRCEAHPTTGYDLLAAKVYRPRMFRQLRNDKMYREGRAILTEEGHEVKKTDTRIMRALGKKTAYGQQVEHQSWLMYEFTTLQRLYEIGASVPKPVAVSTNAILMSFCGDENMAAPLLVNVDLDNEEAEDLFKEVMRNVELMLMHGLIHGDLSAYNILYWEGEITLIDFPQVTKSQSNSQAHFILKRDIERVCQYFESQGVDCNPSAIMRDLWKRYVEGDPKLREADLSRREVEMDEA
jgi:RIO kinase 1